MSHPLPEPRPAPRAVTLDATGTLFHVPRLAETYAEVLARHGMQAPLADLRGLIPRVWQEMECRVELGRDRYRDHPGGSRGWWRRFLERLCEYLELPPPSPFAAAELYSRFGRGDAYEVFPEVTATLAGLHARGVPLAVVSNWDERLPRVLEELDLARWFDAVVYSWEVGVEKPHPAIFERALAALGVEPHEALHVGDGMRDDVEGALGVGMEALFLLRPGTGHRRRDHAAPAGDLADLTPLVALAEPRHAPPPVLD